MSTTELRQTVDGLSESERVYLAAYLRAVNLAHSGAYRAEVSRRMQEMDQGRFLDAAAVKELHQALETKGL